MHQIIDEENDCITHILLDEDVYYVDSIYRMTRYYLSYKEKRKYLLDHKWIKDYVTMQSYNTTLYEDDYTCTVCENVIWHFHSGYELLNLATCNDILLQNIIE